MTKAKKVKAELVKVLKQQNDKFDVWSAMVKVEVLKFSNLDKRMELVLDGIRLGLTERTALGSCYVSKEEFMGWLNKADNGRLYRHAISEKNARLEAMTYKSAESNPFLALDLMNKSDKDNAQWRFTDPEKRNVKFTLSTALSKDNPPQVDVTT